MLCHVLPIRETSTNKQKNKQTTRELFLAYSFQYPCQLSFEDKVLINHTFEIHDMLMFVQFSKIGINKTVSSNCLCDAKANKDVKWPYGL
jgi:hypothetical protein